MRERIVLIGQAPNRLGRPDRPLIGGRSGEFLRDLTGLSLFQYARRFERRNVLERFPGCVPSGDLFPRDEARQAAAEMIGTLVGRRVIFVGRAVAYAFGVSTCRNFDWQQHSRGFEFAVIPHPSARNRFWNDSVSRVAAMGFFARLGL